MQPEVIEAMRMLPPTAKIAIGVTVVLAYLGKTYYETVNDTRVQKTELVNQQQKIEFTQKEFEQSQLIAKQAEAIERLTQQSKLIAKQAEAIEHYKQKESEQSQVIAEQSEEIERLETTLFATQEELKKKWF